MIRALYGGTFDPIHAGHVAVAGTLLARGLADVVHVVPARQSPLKTTTTNADGATRVELARLALSGMPGVVVDDREITRPGPSYTVDTLADLAREHPDDRWRLIIGADNVADFPLWRDPQRLLRLAEPLVLARGPVTLVPPLAGRAVVIDDFDHPANATAIRDDLAAGRMPGPALLPPVVADRIAAGGLYGWPGPSNRH